MRGLCLMLAAALGVSVGCAGPHCTGGPPIVCPQCHHHCQLEVETVKEKKSCFDVECEAICIPHVKLPWEDCCEPPKCARTRLVHVLVEKDYECERCHYKWTPVCCEPCDGEPKD
jgi:hypothetical protein